MELYLKITAILLLTVHALHLASLQESTDNDYSGTASGDDSGIISGSMAINYTEEENLISHAEVGNNGSEVIPTTVSTVSSSTTMLPEMSITVTITTTGTTKQSPVNMPETEGESSDSASSSQTSTTQPGTTTTQKSTTTTTELNQSPTTSGTTTSSTTTSSATTSRTTTSSATTSRTTTSSTTVTPTNTMTFNSQSTTTTLPPETTQTIQESTTSGALNTPEINNRTGLGGDAERGYTSDTDGSSKRNGAWAAVLGTGVAVVFVGLVAYVILKRKRQRDFSHRKLVEEFHPDPVLRLDNSEPLDLNYGGGAYYNPALQGDNIKMSNFSRQHQK